MSKKLEQRMNKLEQSATSERLRISRIELVNGATGEVMAVIYEGSPLSNCADFTARASHPNLPTHLVEQARLAAFLS